MTKTLALIIAVLVSFTAAAEAPLLGARLETETFTMLLPAGWKETAREQRRIQLAGTGQETADISVARILGEGSPEEKEPSRSKLKANLRKAIESGTQSPSYLVAQPLQEKVVANGNTFISAKLRTRDGLGFAHQYGVLGPGAGLLITVEGPMADLFSATMLEYFIITTVQWK
jgi:hypothetical protein